MTLRVSSCALADDDDVDLLADGGVGHHARQILRLLDVLAVELDHDVAGLDAGRLRRALVLDAGDQRAARGLDVEAFGDLVGDLLDADAEPAAAKLAELPQLIDHAGHRLRGHRKADADRAAGRRDDQRVDADHFAVEIEQRPAGIAAVDGGVGLDVVVIGTRADIAVARRDDAGGDRAAEAERIADRDHPFAEPQLVGIAELHRDQRLVRLEFQHRQIGLLVDADQLGLELAAVVHDDVDLVGIRDDVIVGHDDARGVDDEAGAERVGLVRLQSSPPLEPPPGPPRRFLKKSSKNSSNGEPGGNCGIAPLPSPPPPLASTVCEVEMLTTASITFSATSAMPSGPRAKAGADTMPGRWRRRGRSRPARGAGDGSGLESHRSYQISLLANGAEFEVHSAPERGCGASI